MSFKKFLEKNNSPGIIFSFGRFNPAPTDTHQLLFNIMEDYNKKYNVDAVIYTSQITNSKKNPLSYQDKISYLKESIKDTNIRVSEENLKNVYEILEDLIKNKNYKRIYFVIGENRVNDYSALYKYAKEWGDVDFKIITGLKESENVVTGSDMRRFVKENDFESFENNIITSLKEKAKEIFEKTKKGLKL